MPQEIDFKTKPWIALDQIRWACQAGLPGDVVLLDAGYGHDSKLRTGITEVGKLYVAGIQPQMLVSKPGKRPGRAPKRGPGEKGPTKYWLSTLAESISFRDLVDAAKLRWRIEREVGLASRTEAHEAVRAIAAPHG